MYSFCERERNNISHPFLYIMFMELFDLNTYRLSELMKSIVKKPILPYVKTLTLEMVVNDHNDDVEVNIKETFFGSLKRSS